MSTFYFYSITQNFERDQHHGGHWDVRKKQSEYNSWLFYKICADEVFDPSSGLNSEVLRPFGSKLGSLNSENRGGLNYESV